MKTTYLTRDEALSLLADIDESVEALRYGIGDEYLAVMRIDDALTKLYGHFGMWRTPYDKED